MSILMTILYEHHTPTPWIWIAFIATVGVCAWLYLRYLGRKWTTLALAALRLVFLLLLLWCLFLPQRKITRTEVRRPRFVVALDRSRSMLMTPDDQQSNRWDSALGMLDLSWPDVVAASADIDAYAFAGELGAKTSVDTLNTLEANGETTRLRENLARLRQRYTGQEVVGCLLLTDGRDTREAYADWASDDWPFPIYTVRLEEEGLWNVEPDIHVDTITTPRRVLVGWDTDLRATISAEGTQGQPITVRLLRNGSPIDETAVVVPAEGGSRDVLFRLTHDAVGSDTYLLHAQPYEGESHTNDNQLTASVQVVDTRNRLMYAEGAPRWESKFLTRVLRANRSVQSLVFIRGPEGKFITFGKRGSMTLDMTESQLNAFKVVILGNFSAEELNDDRARSLLQFVTTGGSLIVLGGDRAWSAEGLVRTALNEILPIARPGHADPIEGNFPLTLTPEGAGHEAFLTDDETWETLPAVMSVFPGSRIKAGASTLIEAETPHGKQPVLVSQRYGAGKIVAVLTDSLWRWQLNPVDSKPYQRFWNQMISWMLPEESEVEDETLQIFSDTELIFLGDAVRLSARAGGYTPEELAGAVVQCVLKMPDKREIPFPMQADDVVTATGERFSGFMNEITAEMPGMHEVYATARFADRTLQSEPLSFYVKPYTPEAEPRPADVDLLKRLSAASGGRFCEAAELDGVLSNLAVHQIDEERVTYATLWNTHLILTCLMTFLSLEWTLRKVRNMA